MGSDEKSPASLDDPLLKAVPIVGPIIASTIAVSYDVGYFTGLDAGYFTFFSLSEHLVFALQALPFIVLALVGIFGIFFSGYLGMKHGRARDEQVLAVIEQLSSPARNEAAESELRFKRRMRVVWAIGLILSVIIAILLHKYTLALFSVVGAGWILMRKTPAEMVSHFGRRPITLFVAGALLVAAFLIGLESAGAMLSSKEATHTVILERGPIAARLIRSGERGVLLVSVDTKRPRFERWEAVKSVETR